MTNTVKDFKNRLFELCDLCSQNKPSLLGKIVMKQARLIKMFNERENITLNQSSNGWISVDDELPKTFTNVLVYSKLKINDELFDCVGIGYIDDDKFWQYDESFGYHHCDPYFIKAISSSDLMNVQYWQPLPEPPKE